MPDIEISVSISAPTIAWGCRERHGARDLRQRIDWRPPAGCTCHSGVSQVQQERNVLVTNEHGRTDLPAWHRHVPLRHGRHDRNAVIFAQPGPPGPPVAVISAPTSGNVRNCAHRSTGVGPGIRTAWVASYAWDFGDNVTADRGPPSQHTYSSGGTFTSDD